MDLNLTPEDIETLVKNTIMKSGFGAAVEKAVAYAITGYNNPIDAEVKKYVAFVAAGLLRERFREKVHALVEKAIEEKVTAELLEKVTNTAMQKMAEAAERY